MAYPRRVSGTHLAPSTSPRRAVQGGGESEDESLPPPRPFFLAADSANRSSNSSFDNSSLDPPSDSDSSPPEIHLLPRGAAPPQPHPLSTTLSQRRTHTRKASSMSQSRRNSIEHPETPTSASTLLFKQHVPKSPPPSSFAFPFQAYPGNPDPGTHIPGMSRRRSSLDSVNQVDSTGHESDTMYHPLSHTGSMTDLRRPVAPFMANSGAGDSTGSLPRSSSSNSIYKQSAAANLHAGGTSIEQQSSIPRNASVHSFRAPFLSPASRPTSSLWAPPSYNNQIYSNSIPLANASPNGSSSALPLGSSAFLAKSKPPLPSTRLAAPLEKSEKPWLAKPEPRARLSYFITLFCIFLGVAGAAALVYFGVVSVDVLEDSDLCSVMDEQFNGGSLDDSTWNREVELGGFGNGEFQMTTNSDDNLFFQNGQLYIMPTLTSDKVSNIFDGKFTLDGCNTSNKTACSVTANQALGTVINPVMSARINTMGKKTIKFGKVEFRAKLPTGDWLWPAVWMLPQDNFYGPWPVSGEIDILEARGNGISYPSQGSNFVRSSLNYGPFSTLVENIFGWFSLKRTSFADGFHTYTMEWTEDFMRFSVDSKLHAMLLTQTKSSGKKNNYWDKAGFPQTARNGSDPQLSVVENPYSGKDGVTRAAPFDRPFYLVVDLAVGGTSGWFPDNVGGKMWFDGSNTAMRDFAKAQDEWSKTWPSSANDRAFRM
ncbi:hypothetical protein D9613_010576 [Agrocybe pediades]|uniref:GH16 domain-containing protein n=1 Tax=Agrocybe pediades TaxID=84607 RepID=A0A8H4QGD3_9AGAR|nr:hypothetical protein D9613_010576 [Agrocybe pediades]